MKEKPIAAGGQAVIEGVMMKTQHYFSLAVRTPDKKIHVESKRYKSLAEKHKILGKPFLRGIVNLIEMMHLGFKTLMRSADLAGEEDEQLSSWGMTLTIIFAVLFAIGLFVFLPYLLTYLFGFSEDKNALAFNFVDGIIKLGIFAIYVYLISFMKDIRRTFQYHGAEHMTVNCLEAKKELTVNNCEKFKTYHPRCGTSFVMFVFFVMIILFSVIPGLLNFIFPSMVDLSFLQKRVILFVTRIFFIIPVASISYEVLKLSGKFHNNFLFKIIAFPGKLIQGITTRKPTKNMLEVAISALKAVLKKEKSFKSNI